MVALLLAASHSVFASFYSHSLCTFFVFLVTLSPTQTNKREAKSMRGLMGYLSLINDIKCQLLSGLFAAVQSSSCFIIFKSAEKFLDPNPLMWPKYSAAVGFVAIKDFFVFVDVVFFLIMSLKVKKYYA